MIANFQFAIFDSMLNSFRECEVTRTCGRKLRVPYHIVCQTMFELIHTIIRAIDRVSKSCKWEMAYAEFKHGSKI